MPPLHLGRIMLVVAHPDDETGSAAILLQRSHDPIVVFCTDGAPADPWFWRRFETRSRYVQLRRAEATLALQTIAVHEPVFLSTLQADIFQDQRLHTALPQAIDVIAKLAREYAPDSIVAPAYEGGHPDHDSCSLIANVVGDMTGTPVWEVPLYHRSPNGTLRYQEFAQHCGSEVRLVPTQAEALAKQKMLNVYASQPDLDVFAASPFEWIRPQFAYDYSRPPAPVINYECWGWPFRATEICADFSRVMISSTGLPTTSAAAVGL